MKRGPFTVTSSEEKYKNPWITVREDQVIKPDGKTGMFGVIEYSTGAAVVAVNNKKEIFLVREYAYAINEESLSTPSGGVDEGENPLEAAKRELLEEAGVSAEKWTSLGKIDPFTMIINGPMHLFLAEGAQITGRAEEEFELEVMPFMEAFKLVMEGKITHGGSCVAILKAKEYLYP